MFVTDRFKLNYKNPYDWSGEYIEINHSEPSKCPICKTFIKPIFIYGYANMQKCKAFIMYECNSCNTGFIKHFTYRINTNDYIEIGNYYLAPDKYLPCEFSKYIINISKNFINIYNQAREAEHHNLFEVAGMGYRKALEFLIKDYITKDFIEENIINNIHKKPLINCINEYINNENIKIASSRAIWIGNDETHYIRKHDDKDIKDLKRLIDLTVRWIEMECMTQEAKKIEYKK